MGRSGREPGGSYQRPKGTALQDLGQVCGRGGEPTYVRFGRVSPRIFPKTKPSRQTGRGEGERAGTRPCPARVWGPRTWLLRGVLVPPPLPNLQCLFQCPPRTLTRSAPESRSQPPQPPARAPPPQHRQQPPALSASGLGRAHWCARPFPPPPGPKVAANTVALRLPVPGSRRVDAATGGGACGGAIQPTRGSGTRGTPSMNRCARSRTRALCCREIRARSAVAGAPRELRILSHTTKLRFEAPGAKSSAQRS